MSLEMQKSTGCGCGRRDFLKGMMGCGAWTLLGLAGAGALQRRAFAQPGGGETVLETDFAHVEKLADDLWAIVSTPQLGAKTFSNGGIIAGRDAVLMVEGFNTPAGAAWAAGVCRQLTGRAPTHVVLTHYHPDHSNGLAGYWNGGENPAIISTLRTRELLLNSLMQPDLGASPDGLVATGRQVYIPETLIAGEGTTELDLGGRTVRLEQRMGHTPSDVTISVTDPAVTWCGDLFFNGLMPYYGDAIPSALRKTVSGLFADEGRSFVPGHGAVATRAEIGRYLDLLDFVEAHARKAHAAGTSAQAAGDTMQFPASLGELTILMPPMKQFAVEAWYRELNG